VKLGQQVPISFASNTGRTAQKRFHKIQCYEIKLNFVENTAELWVNAAKK